MSEPISEETLAEIEAAALKARRTGYDHVPVTLVNLACENVPSLIAEVKRINLQNNDLRAALSLLKSELKERGERIESVNQLISMIRNYVNEEGVSDTAKVIRVQGVVNKRSGSPICMIQTNCHGGTCGNLLPCEIHPGQHF